MNTTIVRTSWQILILSLPAASATPRMRIWRNLKTLGCGVLRDGVYLLPQPAAAAFDEIASETIAENGTAWVLDVQARDNIEEALFLGLFERNSEYAEFVAGLRAARKTLASLIPQEITRLIRKCGRDYDTLRSVDYFPNEFSADAEMAWVEFRATALQILSPDEPQATSGDIAKLDLNQYQNKIWATRRRLWVDRVASAWLILRFIDKQAQFLWLSVPADCPTNALGFDFDGATFTHIKERVTFEVLLACFDLEDDPGLKRLGTIVHALDMGGEPVSEAAGLEAIMTGMRQRLSDDNQLLGEMCPVLDALYSHFSEQNQKKN